MIEDLAHRTAIKGTRDGILIMLGEGPFDQALGDLAVELDGKKDFLRGSRVILDVKDRQLTAIDLSRVQILLENREINLWTVLAELPKTREEARKLGLATRLAGSNVDLEGNTLTSTTPITTIGMNNPPLTTPQNGSNSLLIQETIRSGRSILHDGHVVVIGDVNPGAEIIAGGNVVVWGKLRGMVHAGAFGDDSAVICALELIPTQLRIADQIAVSPNEERRHPSPESVSIRDGQLIAESWQKKR